MTEIRADWPLTNLGEEFEIQQGKSLSPNSRRGQKPRPFLRTSNVLWGRVDLTTVDQMDFTDEEFSRLSLVDGDLLVCEGGDIGRAAVYRGPSGHYAYQNHLHRLRAKTDQIIPDFVVHWLRAAFTQLGLYEGVGNKTTIPNLSRARLAQLQIPKPDPDEQRQVASILGNVQRAIEVQAAICDKLAALKSATMAKLFREGLRGEPLKHTDIGPVPRNWRVDRLVEFAHFQRGYDITKKDQKHGTVPVVSSGGIKSWHDVASAKGPGVVIGRKGSIGEIHYVEQDFWPHDTTLFATDFKGNVPLFVYYRLSVLDLKRLDSGAANPALNRNFLHQELISWPDTDEQRSIATILQTIDRSVSIHDRKRLMLQELFRTVLPQLMTGAVRVKDLDLAEVSHA